ncbi:hypothetical protein GGQ87_002750 [Brevundimonas alba]|uniref:Uncharacterized protein n=1 Tax=Brevundimonas alba TaxID=74314 RepID=A0A7X6BQ42_9CAUL|nr:DUF6880 family protein [Brevundimonas alba]NJC42455.1 hypothetical protein [Brevundimonas alba]
MAKRPTSARKSLNAANLQALGPERLADLLVEVAGDDAIWKRRLKMELAAEAGAADLAFEIDKRLTLLATSRTRVSWRKRPETIRDLQALRLMIVERLAPLEARLALDRLIAWFDLYPGLSMRVKDPKDELGQMFDAATADLGAVSASATADVAGPVLAEAVLTRLSDWGRWMGRATSGLDKALARSLLTELTQGRPAPTGRLALVVRKLADRTDDVDQWAATIPDADRAKPEVGAEMARRLAAAGRVGEARAALDAARVQAPPSRWGRSAAPAPPADGWLKAEIAVLEAEGRPDEATAARWALFDRSLDAGQLRTLIAALPDFEDVVAIERAHTIAASWSDADKGLAFLMSWPAHREAAEMIVKRAGALRGTAEDIPLWAGRLAGRYPVAAMLLLRVRIRTLVQLGAADEAAGLVAEAAALAEQADLPADVPDHAAFAAALEIESRRSRWGRR